MKTLSLDIETTGLEWSVKILSVGAAWRDDSGEIVKKAWPLGAYDLFHSGLSVPELRGILLPLVQRADLIFGHNFAFDLSYLFKVGILRPQEVKGKLFDTLMGARMTASHDRVNLAAVAQSFGIGDDAWRAAKLRRTSLSKVAVSSLLEYQEQDVYFQLLTGEAMYAKALELYEDAFLRRQMDFCRVVASMRVLGRPLDKEKTQTLIDTQRERKRWLMHNLLWPNHIMNVNAHTDIARYVHRQDLPAVAWTKKGNEQLNEEAFKKLKRLAKPGVGEVLDAILEVKGIEKAINTWLEPFLEYAKEDGAVHPNFTVAGAVSYRLTCSDPGLQAVPEMDIWQPRLSADYSQAEYRLPAMYSRFNELARGYASGLDAHTITASMVLGKKMISDLERKHYGKVPNFATLYGAGEEKWCQMTGLSLTEVRSLRNKVKKAMGPMIKLFYDVKDIWEERGFIKLWDGKRIYSVGWDKRSYKALNQLCQGGVAALCQEAMMKLDDAGIPMYSQTHDEISFPPDQDPEAITSLMMAACPEWLSQYTDPPILMKVDVKMKPYVKSHAPVETPAPVQEEDTAWMDALLAEESEEEPELLAA